MRMRILLRRMGVGAVVLASLTGASAALASISYTAYGEEEQVWCYGSGFTPNGSVGIGTYYDGEWIAGTTITANSSGDIIYPSDPGGNCIYTQSECYGYFESYAYDDTTKTYSEGVEVYVDCDDVVKKDEEKNGQKTADQQADQNKQ